MRGMFRLAFLTGAAITMLGVAMTHHAFAAASRPARGPAPQYNVLFSRDDKLCTTLRDFYNRHLHDADSEAAGLIEDQFGRELRGTGTEFISQRDDWRPPSDSLFWPQILPALDIYNDGGSHAVIVLDSTINERFGTLFTEVLILKAGVEPKQVPLALNRNYRSNSRIEQSIDFSHGGSSLSTHGPVYEVTEIPASSDRSFLNLPATSPLIGNSFQRIVRSQNRVYGVARNYIDPPFDDFIRRGAEILRNPILVYSANASGAIADICYLEFAFTRPPRRNMP
jgi:hypothetical protein